MVVFTLGLVVVGFLQYLNYRSQLDVARKDQRPWIKLSAHFLDTKKDDAYIVPEIEIVNIGKSLAKSVNGQFFIEKVEGSNTPTFDTSSTSKNFTASMFTSAVVFPNEPNDLSYLAKRRITPQESEDFWGNKTIYFVFFANISYKDVFGKPHWTKFCTIFSPPTDVPFRGRSFEALTRCLEYNDIDED